MDPPQLNTQTAWKQYYGDVKTYKDWYTKYEQIQPLLAAVAQEDSEILELGCGTSRLCAELGEHGYKNVTAIDYDDSVVEFMRHSAPGAYFLTQDARRMQFPESVFDVVIAKATLDFMLEDITEAVQIIGEAWRVLKTNGCFLVLTQVHPKVIDRLLQFVVWNTVYLTYIPPNIGCLSNTGSAGAVLGYICFK